MIIGDVAGPKVQLHRIIIVGWYGIARLDVEVRGNVALIGRNGAGKSSLIDLIQFVMSGGNRHFFLPNASAEVTSGTSKRDERRSVLEYCIGSIEGRVLRPESVTYVGLVFKSVDSDDVWTAGMGLSAREGDTDAVELGSFIAKGFDLTTADFVRNGRTRPYDEIQADIRKARGGGKVTFLRGRPGEFSTRLLRELTGDPHLDSQTYLRALKNSLAFKAMDDPTDFVRRYVLPAPGLSSSKVEGLRRSYANWRAIEERVQKAAIEQERISDISSRLEVLTKRRQEAARWGAVEVLAEQASAAEAEAHAGRRAGEAEAKVREAQERLAMSREALAEVDRTIAVTSAELGEQTMRDELAARRSELKRAEDDEREADARVARLSAQIMGIGSLRPVLAEEADAIGEIGALKAIEAFSVAAAGDGPINAALRPLIAALDDLPGKAEAEENRVRDEAADVRSARAEDMDALARFRSGGALLGERTSALIAALVEAGIEAQPLCSLVELVDERWRDAAETMLGGAREALIVDPSDVSRAIRVMDEGGRRFEECSIYDAKETDRGSPSARPGTLAAMLRTTNPYARAFLNVRIGNLVCVEDREDLRNHARAVTPSVLAKGGGAIFKPRMPRNRLLGLTAQKGSVEDLQRRVDLSAQRLSALGVRAERLRRIASHVTSFLELAESSAGDLEEATSRIRDAAGRAAAAQVAINSIEKALSSDKFQALRLLEEDRKGYLEDLAADEEELTQAAQSSGQAKERLGQAAAKLAQAAERVDEIRSAIEADLFHEAEDALTELQAQFGGPAAVVKEARSRVEAAGGRIEQRLQAVRQDAANYARDHNVEFDAGETLDDLSEWISRRMAALEGDVLAKYREQATTAREEMEKAIYDDFILNLANDLAMGKAQVNVLNKVLRGHRFNGERFEFTDSDHRDYADVVALSRAVLTNERRVSDLFDPDPDRASDLSDKEERGMKKIRAIFEGGGDLDHFTDYRNYLTFDLVSYDAETGARIAGSRERSKRSGGERQVPFYIAMASAMASVCFRGRRRGMGLAMFDEAFNALDNGNISASLAMMRQLGLQFLLSAPTEKASAFIPHVDTVINVSRHGEYCQIDVEYPTEYARTEMISRDPSISGMAAVERNRRAPPSAA